MFVSLKKETILSELEKAGEKGLRASDISRKLKVEEGDVAEILSQLEDQGAAKRTWVDGFHFYSVKKRKA
jgi:predicted transcriptional regulator